MCDITRDWSRRMAEAHEMSKELGVRIRLTPVTVPVIGDDGHVASVTHYVPLKTKPDLDDAASDRYWRRVLAECSR